MRGTARDCMTVERRESEEQHGRDVGHDKQPAQAQRGERDERRGGGSDRTGKGQLVEPRRQQAGLLQEQQYCPAGSQRKSYGRGDGAAVARATRTAETPRCPPRRAALQGAASVQSCRAGESRSRQRPTPQARSRRHRSRRKRFPRPRGRRPRRPRSSAPRSHRAAGWRAAERRSPWAVLSVRTACRPEPTRRRCG